MSGNTVFIIGAGASEEAKLPAGDALKTKIAKLLDIRFDEWGGKLEHGDRTILEALKKHARQNDVSSLIKYLHAAHLIRDALPQAISIDNFIDAHPDNDLITLCGKLAIVRSILNAEKSSLLYFAKSSTDTNIKYSSLQSTWYIPFFQLLTENCSKDNLEERFESITLIIFNYDRCIEHCIYYALQNYYNLPKEEAAKLIKIINIYHPYGDVGTLPWMNQNGAMKFGADTNYDQLLELSKKIKTFTEGTDTESSEILEIRKKMSMASRFVFLGFAFHKLNMQIIAPGQINDKSNSKVRCFATTYGISDNDKEIIEEQIKNLYHNEIRVNLANLKCCEFFIEFWRSLSF